MNGRPRRATTAVRTLAVIGGLASATLAANACGLVLGIDAVPNVQPVSDAGFVDARPEAAPPQHDAADAGPVGKLPLPSGPETTSNATVNFALRYLWLGETDKTSAFIPDPSAWATFGYNIDGLVTTSLSTDVCTRSPNASSAVQIDGNEGTDNSFGENVVGYLSIAFSGLSKALSGRVAAGDFTLLINTTGLSESPTQTNVGLTAELLGGSRKPTPPTFRVTDNWPVDPTSLVNPTSLAGGAKTSFSDSYISNGTWVSGPPASFLFGITIDSEPLALIVHQAVLTFQHTVDDAGVHHATNGTVTGILIPSEFVSGIRAVAGGINDGGYCSDVELFAAAVFAAQDILEDGTNSPGKPCDAVSVGIAFSGDQIELPSVIGTPATMREGGLNGCPFDAGDTRDAGE